MKMNEKNNQFFRKNFIGNVVETLLENLILDDENPIAFYGISNDKIDREGKSGFYDYALLLSDKRIIRINISEKGIINESFSLKEIEGSKIIKDYYPSKERIQGTD